MPNSSKATKTQYPNPNNYNFKSLNQFEERMTLDLASVGDGDGGVN